MSAVITLIGNEGFLIETPTETILIDPFYAAIPGVAGKRCMRPGDLERGDLILVTHSHWDHFRANEVAEAARRTGARVVGPPDVVERLRGKAPNEQLCELAPAPPRPGRPYDRAAARFGAIRVTAFGTHHGRLHNSYLVETPSLRFFHDGDNEDTRRLPVEELRGLDALFLAPWQGGGWVEFVEAVAARRYFMMHMTEEELDEIEAGTYFPEICDHTPLPDTMVVLRPGQRFELE